MNGKMIARCLIGIVLMLFMSAAFSFGAKTTPSDAIELKSGQTSIKDVLDVKIPSSWGIIRDSYDSGADKLIVNIQDAHCDFQEQQNISKILDRLAANYKLKVIALEGASGKIQNPILTFFPEKNVKKEVSSYLVREGKLTGAEFLAANSDYGLKLYGVEDIRLYMDNLEAFQQSQPFKQEAKQYFGVLRKALDKLKPYIYNGALIEYNELETGFSQGQIPFDKYALSLFKLVQEQGLNRVNYPTFYELQKAIALEAKVDFNKADTERAQLITELIKNASDKKDISALVEYSLNFKKGIVSAATFAQFLKDLAFKMRLNLMSYPNFSAYADYITKYEEVANENLFAELKQVKADLRNTLYTNDDQKQLDILYKDVEVLSKLVDLQMINEDIDYFFKNRAKMNTDSFKTFIETHAKKSRLEIHIPADISYIDVYLPAWAKFYELADMRDIAFVEKTLKYMDQEKVNHAALIAGGFHTEQLTKILKSRDISYLVITPRASGDEDNLYLNRMQGKKTDLEMFLQQLQSTLGILRGVDEETLKNSGLSKEQVAYLNTNNKDTLELHVGALATVRAMNIIEANQWSNGNIDWETVTSQIKGEFADAFKKAGITKTDDLTGLNKTVDGVINGLKTQAKQETLQNDQGAVTVITERGNVFTYNLNNPEGSQIALLQPSEKLVGEANVKTLNVATTTESAKITGSMLTAFAEKQDISSIILGEVASALTEAANLSSNNSVDDRQVMSELISKLLDSGLDMQTIDEFIGSITMPNIHSSVNPFVIAAVRHIVSLAGIKETGQTAELMNDLTPAVSQFIIATTPEAKDEAFTKIQNVLKKAENSTPVIKSDVDKNINVAGLSTSHVVVKATSQLLKKVGITKKQQTPALINAVQAAVAGVMFSDIDTQTAIAQLKDVITNAGGIVQNFEEAAVKQIKLTSFSSNPVFAAAAKQVAGALGITKAEQTNEVMGAIEEGIVNIVRNKADVAEVAEAINSEVNRPVATAENLGAVVGAQTNPDTLAANPGTEQIAKTIMRSAGIDDSGQIDKLKPGIVNVILAALPQEESAAKTALAEDIKNISGKDVKVAVVDTAINSFNQASFDAAEGIANDLKLDDTQKAELMPVLEASAAQIMLTKNPDTRTQLIDKLADTLAKLPDIKQTKSELVTKVTENITRATAATNAQAFNIVQIDNVRLNQAANNFRGRLLLDGGITAQTVIKAKAALAKRDGVSANGHFADNAQNMPEEIQTAIQKAGMQLANTNVILSANADIADRQLASDKVSINVSQSKDGSNNVTLTLDNMLENKQSLAKSITNNNKIIDQLHAKASDLWSRKGLGGLLTKLISANPDEIKDNINAEKTKYGDRIREMQGKTKLIVLDEGLVLSLQGNTMKEAELRLGAYFSKSCIEGATQKGSVVIAIKENPDLMLIDDETGKNIKIDLNNFIQNLPDQFSQYRSLEVIDSNAVAQVYKTNVPLQVTHGAVLEVAEKRYGKGNVLLHFISPDDETNRGQLAELMRENEGTITYSLFDKDIGPTQIRDGDAYIAEALTMMIVGTEGGMKDLNREGLVAAILANFKIDMSKDEISGLLNEPLESTKYSKIINLKEEIKFKEIVCRNA